MIELQTEEEKKALFGLRASEQRISALHAAVALKNGRITALLLELLSSRLDVLDDEGCRATVMP